MKKIAIVYSSFNFPIVQKLLKGCDKYLTEQKIDTKPIDRIEVPGAFEIPLACKKLAKTKKYDAIITLGCVIKGQTEHYEMICKAVTDGIMKVMLDEEIPIIFEVLMVTDVKYAVSRANTKIWSENKGYEAAKTALSVIPDLIGNPVNKNPLAKARYS